MRRASQFVYLSLLVSLFWPCPGVLAEPSLAITGYELTEQIKLGKGVYQFVYRAAVTNTGSDAMNVRATLESTPSIVEIIEPDLQFGDVPAGTTELSDDTFTVRQARKGSRGDFPVDPMRFVWSFETGNAPPVADAGPDQTVEVGASVQLDGSGSSDPDGDILDFDWSFAALPPGSAATLSDPTLFNPTFTADLAGSYTLELVVNDGELYSEADTVTVTTENSPPVADAGSDQTIHVTDTVVLDGSGSSDVDGDPLTYAWTFESVPPGSTA